VTGGGGDQEYLAEALATIREHVVSPRSAFFTTREQAYYGFTLSDVSYASDGEVLSARESLDLTVYRELEDRVNDLVADIEWDGVMGEDKHGDAEIMMNDGSVG
jgi:hypothetical protein